MKELISFLDYVSYEKRYSANTVQSYSNDLEQFFLFVKDRFDDTDVRCINRPIVRSWVVHLVQQNSAPSTIRRKISSLQSFFKFLRKKGVIEHNPTLSLQLPKKGSKVPSFIKMNEMDSSIEHMSVLTETDYKAILEKSIVLLLYYTGVRRGEIIDLKLNDFNTKDKSLSVIGKGNKQRVLPLSNELVNVMTHYLTAKSSLDVLVDKEYLFVTPSGKKLYPNFVHRAVKYYLEGHVHAEKVSPHLLRHSFASHLSQNGADLNAIKSLLGHASLSSTQIYTHHSLDGLKRIYESTHPKSE